MGLLDRRPPMMKRDVPYEETTQGMTGLLGRAFYPDGYSGGLLGMEPWASKAARYAEAHRGQAPSAPSADQLMSALEVMPGMDPSNLAAGMMGKIVYHGTPHAWLPEPGFPKGRPRLDKIGTGEGAQAYGHGFYAADVPDTAIQYRDALASERGFSFGGQSDLTRDQVLEVVKQKYGGKYLDNVTNPTGVADFVIDDMVTGRNRAPGELPRRYAPGSERAKLYEELKSEIKHASPGALLKLDLPDEAIDRMLDWDAPLSQQPEAVRKVLDVRVEDDARGGFEVVSNIGRPHLSRLVVMAQPTGLDSKRAPKRMSLLKD
jgi:hypothetical protein